MVARLGKLQSQGSDGHEQRAGVWRSQGRRWGSDEGLFVPEPKNARSELGRRNSGGWKLPTGLLLLLLLRKRLRISLCLNNSDKMSVTMATRENKLIREVSDIRNA